MWTSDWTAWKCRAEQCQCPSHPLRLRVILPNRHRALVHSWIVEMNKVSSCESLCDFVRLTSLLILCLPICDIKDQMSDVYPKHKHTLTGIKDIVCASAWALCIWSCVSYSVIPDVWSLMFLWARNNFSLLCLTWLLKADMKCVCVGKNREKEIWFPSDGVSLKIHNIKESVAWCLHTLTRGLYSILFPIVWLCDCRRFGCLIAVWRGVSRLCSFASVSADMWH